MVCEPAFLHRRVFGRALLLVEIVLLSALILAARCANYREVFVGGAVYFTDADCYARMNRVRLCLEHPGLILRHHDFENYPAGINPHTTALFDYIIVAIAWTLTPLTAGARDLAGALVSPLLGLLAGWFLWGWSVARRLPFRRGLLFFYAICPMLVHGTLLGRPDHQSLLILLLAVAFCAEWTLQTGAARAWQVAWGAAWGAAIWTSLYEPLVLLGIVLASEKFRACVGRKAGWMTMAGVLALALLIERRGLAGSAFNEPHVLRNWAGTIGELAPVRWNDPVWLRWAGLLLIPSPVLLWLARRERPALVPAAVFVPLAATYLLTLWQARWGYFFALLFVFSLPAQLSALRRRRLAFALFALALWPVLGEWDRRLFPDEAEATVLIEQRAEAADWHAAAAMVARAGGGPILAPWWLSPSAAYWSSQPAVAGSAHEGIGGIAESARFFLATDPVVARNLLAQHRVRWVMAYDADRVAANSAAILGAPAMPSAFAFLLDRHPSQAPEFLELVFQNRAAKLYRVREPLGP